MQRALVSARSSKARALACYELGLFHDNNTCEAQAVPFYREAIRLGLEPAAKARALAWLASSLCKTGEADEALRTADESLAVTSDVSLERFLVRLKRRIILRTAGRAGG